MIANLLRPIHTFPNLTVTVVGDLMLDAYVAGPARRLSPEAPVPVVDVATRKHAPGGAANTAVNVRALGARCRPIGVTGDDAGGTTLRNVLRAADVAHDDLLVVPDRGTLVKQRVLADRQVVVRFDEGSTHPLDPATEEALIERLRSAWRTSDAVIVSDYGYGVLTDRVIAAIRDLQARWPRVLALDSKRLNRFRVCRPTLAKPNFEEARSLLCQDSKAVPSDRVAWVIARADEIRDATGARIAAITLDTDGGVIQEAGRPPFHAHARRTTHPHPAGAGDTFISAFTLALASGASTEVASVLATGAADHVVAIEGTVPCSAAALQALVARHLTVIDDRAELCALADAYRQLGRRVVLTNGCFDLLHAGHIACLTQARALGDVLIVGLNSDASVERLKGPGRPINPLADRAAMLAALRCVDHVVPFDEETPIDLARQVRPHVFVKGGDYDAEKLPEAATVAELGGTIHILPYVPNHSTTATVTRIRASHEISGSAASSHE